ncbi:calmodulin-binding receptor-like cytoplasmic kinase 2 [Magnolia sinica]|uniref:calmodulin-binding receptor-like cytoplasmic kinase 2 n=1 Tax=Magnolia sinica TaxID=86752 RepID=UPI002657F8C5|nr:calmodulin-binding receptor-like cytoplasmic kinase 2 [Magnolia sinica]
MQSLSPFSGSGKPNSGGRGTADRPDSSPISVYSDTSSSRKSTYSSSSGKSTSGRNPVRIAARALGACFSPSEVISSKDEDLDDSKAASVSSDSSKSNNRRRRLSGGIYSPSYNSTHSEPGGVKFTLEEIYKATRNFSPSFKLGQGGFGTVYKGRLEDGTYVAVKRAKKSVYDKHLSVEFQSEIQTLARVEHLNLVRFFGYLEHEDERIVVVEYVPNGTLREHLDCMHGSTLDLAARLDIAIDVAHAVTYLHMYTDRPIIHRDVKSSNILLTENLRAKVADFGFARLGATDEGVTHVSTQVKGTAGYLDPEYLRTYQLTEKSDVYSFGVLLVELMTGRRPIEPKKELKERVTARWAMKKFTDGNALETLDPRVSRTGATNLALEKIFELALQCLAPTRQSRPSMRRCAEILWSIRKDYRELAASDIESQSSNSHRNSTSLGEE